MAREDGLLAVGGDLSRERLLLAYRLGIFPWFSDPELILWWSPDPRLVLYPVEFKVPARLKRKIRQNLFHVTIDQSFEEVITACARIRVQQGEGTWIVKDMIEAYCRLHESGFAHSVETWYDDKLAGGLYGLSLGRCFFGESMFARVGDASKIALEALVRHLRALSFDFIDCQVTTEHLIRFGAREITRSLFLEQLHKALQAPSIVGRWSFQKEFGYVD